MTEEIIEEYEEIDVDVTEVPMTEGDINELIEKLEELRESKGEVSYELDDENEILFKYIEDEVGGMKND